MNDGLELTIYVFADEIGHCYACLRGRYFLSLHPTSILDCIEVGYDVAFISFLRFSFPHGPLTIAAISFF